MRSLGFASLFLLLAPGHVVGQPTEPTVVLKSNRLQELAPQAAATVREKVINLLKTSNFNSKDHMGSIFPGGARRVQRRYRNTVGGRYLVVVFPLSRHFELIRGQATAIEVIVGLNHPKYSDALFTIDPDGRVVEHSKYSGALATDLLKLVTKLENRLGQDDMRSVGHQYFERRGILYDVDGREIGVWGVDSQQMIVPKR